jgi:HTH-type transcriptional regulator/antitoxin HipB
MKIRTPQDIGAIIRERRLSAGLDQAELAQRAGVGRQWLVEVERGKARAEIGLILRTLNALGVDLDIDTDKRTDSRGPNTPGIDISDIVAHARKPRA